MASGVWGVCIIQQHKGVSALQVLNPLSLKLRLPIKVLLLDILKSLKYNEKNLTEYKIGCIDDIILTKRSNTTFRRLLFTTIQYTFNEKQSLLLTTCILSYFIQICFSKMPFHTQVDKLAFIV